jgi:hypothetical protein
MKTLLTALLGVTIWAASWLVPEVNRVLTPPIMLALVASFTALLTLIVVAGHLSRPRDNRHCPDGACRPGSYNPRTQPVPLPLSR